MSIKTMSSDEILEKIRKHLPVRVKEKNVYGEVFTPIDLINELLDQLPNNVWNNPNLKWLDPANGIGNFPLMIYQRLLNGLEQSIPDLEDRKEHILKNMLYMVELNQENVDISKELFGNTANIYSGSFLEDKWYNHFGVEKFDIIIANPPFQTPKLEKRTGTTAGAGTLWDKFVEKSLHLLDKNGYIGFIHPTNWRGLGKAHKIYKLLRDKVIYLHIYSQKSGEQLFKASTRFDIYIAQKEPTEKPCKVIDETGIEHLIDLSEWDFLPNYSYSLIKKIMTENPDEKINVMCIRSIHASNNKYISRTQNADYKYPVVHSINKNGLGFVYSNDNTKGYFGMSKVLLSFNIKQYSYQEQNDYEGKYGMTQIVFGIPTSSKEEGDEILKAVDTPEFKEIIKATKWGTYQTDFRMFNYFRKDFYEILLNM